MKRHSLLVAATAALLLAFISLARPKPVVLGDVAPTKLPVTPSPTPDRLAAPPTVPVPTQADEGAQLFWLHCQPCHGDQGQGLTDEWRQQYPPEDQNCWNSGCHGNRPYEDGFVLPTAVPAVIGVNSLAGFSTLGQLYDYLKVAMPYQAAGSLTEEEYLAIVAFLAHAHESWDGSLLDTGDLYQQPLQVGSARDLAPETGNEAAPFSVQVTFDWVVIVAALSGAVLLMGALWFLRLRSKE